MSWQGHNVQMDESGDQVGGGSSGGGSDLADACHHGSGATPSEEMVPTLGDTVVIRRSWSSNELGETTTDHRPQMHEPATLWEGVPSEQYHLPGSIAIDVESEVPLREMSMPSHGRPTTNGSGGSISSSLRGSGSHVGAVGPSATAPRARHSSRLIAGASSSPLATQVMVGSRVRDACTQTPTRVGLPPADGQRGESYSGALDLPSAHAMDLLRRDFGLADIAQEAAMMAHQEEELWSSKSPSRPGSQKMRRRSTVARMRWKRAARASPQRRMTVRAMTLRRNAVGPSPMDVELDAPRRLQARYGWQIGGL